MSDESLEDRELDGYLDEVRRRAARFGIEGLDRRAVVRCGSAVAGRWRRCRQDSLLRAHPAVQFEIVRRRFNVVQGEWTRNASACLVKLVADVTRQLSSGTAARRRAV